MSDSPPNSSRKVVLADPSTDPVLNDTTNRVIDRYVSRESDSILRMLSENPDDDIAANVFQMISSIQLNVYSMTAKDMRNFLENLNSQISSVKNKQLKIVLLALFNKMSTECKELITRQQEIELGSNKVELEKVKICEVLTRFIKETVPVGIAVGGSYAFKRAFENQLRRFDLFTSIYTFFSQNDSCIEPISIQVQNPGYLGGRLSELGSMLGLGPTVESQTIFVPVESLKCNVMRGIGSIFGYAGEVAGSGKEITLLVIMLFLTVVFYMLLRILNSKINFMGTGIDFKFKSKKSGKKSLSKNAKKSAKKSCKKSLRKRF